MSLIGSFRGLAILVGFASTGPFLGVVNRLLIPAGMLHQATWWFMGLQIAQTAALVVAAALQSSLTQAAVLFSLAQAGLIVGTTGPGNGYHLARPAEEISLRDVVEAVGWTVRLELPPVPVMDGDNLHRRMQAACDVAAEAGRALLRAVSLADLLDGDGC